jgi:hypothetical protein
MVYTNFTIKKLDQFSNGPTIQNLDFLVQISVMSENQTIWH